MTIRVLVVDDYPMNRELIRRCLPESEFSVTEAKDGVEALQFLSQQSFDAVLLDVMMPGMDGIEVCRHLREDLGNLELPIFLITALDPDESINEVLGENTGYIRKPFNKVKLQEQIRSAVS